MPENDDGGAGGGGSNAAADDDLVVVAADDDAVDDSDEDDIMDDCLHGVNQPVTSSSNEGAASSASDTCNLYAGCCCTVKMPMEARTLSSSAGQTSSPASQQPLAFCRQPSALTIPAAQLPQWEPPIDRKLY